MYSKRERRAIAAEVRRMFRERDPRSVRLGRNGAVTVVIDHVPGTFGLRYDSTANRAVRVFAGWAGDLLADSEGVRA